MAGNDSLESIRDLVASTGNVIEVTLIRMDAIQKTVQELLADLDEQEREEAIRRATGSLKNLRKVLRETRAELGSNCSYRFKSELDQYDQNMIDFEQKFRRIILEQFARKANRDRNLLLYDATGSGERLPSDFSKSVTVTPESITSDFEQVNRVLSDTVASNIQTLARLELSSQVLSQTGSTQKNSVETGIVKSKGILNKYTTKDAVQVAVFYLSVIIFGLLCAYIVYCRLPIPSFFVKK